MWSSGAPIRRPAPRTRAVRRRILTWRYPIYDAFGNVLQEQAPAGPLDGTQGYTLNYVYDTVAQTYRIQVTDSFNYPSGAVYDLRFGAPASQTDVNGNTVVFVRDAFGRLTTVDAPGDPTPGNEHTIAFSYSEQGAPLPSPGGTVSNSLPAFATTAHRDVQNSLRSDRDGHLRGRAQSRHSDQEGPAEGHGRRHRRHGHERQRHRPLRRARSHRAAGSADLQRVERRCGLHPGLAGRPDVVSAYDVLDRTTSVQTFDGATTTTAFGLDTLNGATRLATFVKDPNVNAGGGLPGAVHESFHGVRDNVLAVEETNRLNGSTPTTLLTQYSYDPPRGASAK